MHRKIISKILNKIPSKILSKMLSKILSKILNQRYRIFLFPGKSLTFATFGEKLSEWVKKLYFFFSVLYFFCFRLINLSERVDSKLFLGKKNKMVKIEKFGPEKKIQFSEKKYNFAQNRVSEWGLNYSGGKKYGTFAWTKSLVKSYTVDIILIPPPLLIPPPFLAHIDVRSNIGLYGKYFKNAISR